MRITGPMKRLTVFFSEKDRFGHHALSTELLERAHEAGLHGATLLRGLAGFGTSMTVHTSHVLSLSDDLPLVLVLVDTADRVEAFLPQLGIVESGLVLLEDVEAV